MAYEDPGPTNSANPSSVERMRRGKWLQTAPQELARGREFRVCHLSPLESFSGSRRAGDDARRTARPLKVEFSSFFCVVCVSSRFQYSIYSK